MKPINDTEWLRHLNINITSNSNRIFNNGNQQLEVSVGLTPIKGETITKEQLESVRLVTLDDEGKYQDLSDEYRVSRKRDKRFEYYGASGSAPGQLLESTAYRIRFYVSSTASGGSIKTLYAAVTEDEDRHYVSHTSVFNSSVNVETITKPNRHRSDFNLERVDVLEDKVTDTLVLDGYSWRADTSVDINLYHLEFKNPAFRIVMADAAFIDGLAAYYWGGKEKDGWAGVDGIQPQPATVMKIHYIVAPNSAIKEFKHRHLSIRVNTRPGAMNFIRLHLRGAAPSANVGPPAPGIFSIFDQYGNGHRIKMKPKEEGNLVDFEMHL